jgi:hypothetical protein
MSLKVLGAKINRLGVSSQSQSDSGSKLRQLPGAEGIVGICYR